MIATIMMMTNVLRLRAFVRFQPKHWYQTGRALKVSLVNWLAIPPRRHDYLFRAGPADCRSGLQRTTSHAKYQRGLQPWVLKTLEGKINHPFGKGGFRLRSETSPCRFKRPLTWKIQPRMANVARWAWDPMQLGSHRPAQCKPGASANPQGITSKTWG